MSPTVALFRHETTRWRAAWPISAALLALVLLAPLLPSLETHSVTDVWSMAGLLLAFLYGLGAGLLMGVHLLGTEALRGEVGFYLSLPVTTGRFWAVRVGAAWTTLVLSVALVATPAVLTGFAVDGLDAFGMSEELGYGWLLSAIVLGLPPTLLILGHVLGLAARTRTPWLAVDLLGFVIVAGFVGWSGAVLLGLGAREEAALAVILCGGFSLLALGLGGWRQLHGARSDVARLARLGSLWSWGLLAVGAVAITALSIGWITVNPSELTRVELYQAGPDTAYVTGDYRWRPSYRPLLLIRDEGEEFLRLHGIRGSRLGGYGMVEAFSADGSLGLVRGPESPVLLHSGHDGLELQPLGNLPAARAMTLDADGDRLALGLAGRIVVAEGPGWLATREIRVPRTRGPVSVRFDEDRLIWVGQEGSTREIRVLDLETGALVHRLEISLEPVARLALGPRGALAVVPGADSLTILESASGRTVATLDHQWPSEWRFAPDGSVVVLEPVRPGSPRAAARLRIFRGSADPALDAVLDTVLPRERLWMLGGWTHDGRLILVDHGGAADRETTRLVALEPVTGERELLVEVERSLAPARTLDDRLWPGGVWLRERATGSYWRLDPDDGELRRIFPEE